MASSRTTRAALAAVAVALLSIAAACGSSDSSDTKATGTVPINGSTGPGSSLGGVSSTTAYGYGAGGENANDPGRPATTVVGTSTPSSLASTVQQHLATVHHRTDVTAVSGDDSGIVIATTLPADDAAGGREVCEQAAMVTGKAPISVRASTGATISSKTATGACT
jgi:hypothetical protein